MPPPLQVLRRQVGVGERPARKVHEDVGQRRTAEAADEAALLTISSTRLPALPQIVQVEIVAVGVHGMPETLVEVDRELAVAGQVAQRPLLEEKVGIVVPGSRRPRAEDEEATAHHPSAVGFSSNSTAFGRRFVFRRSARWDGHR